VQGSTVTLDWIPADNLADAFEIEAEIQATNTKISLPVGNQTHLSVPNVPNGNFIVRIRAKNGFGVSEFSASRLVIVGVVLGAGDMQATLSWNSNADIDLHVIEPNGTHVYFASRTGVTARLDRDDTDGFGPENIFVGQGGAASGVYQIFIVHFSRTVNTTSTISIRLNAGTPNERVAFFTRSTSSGSPGTGFNVANVDIRNGTIVEVGGTRAAVEAFELNEEAKTPEPDGDPEP
jgi:hypothetical protein